MPTLVLDSQTLVSRGEHTPLADSQSAYTAASQPVHTATNQPTPSTGIEGIALAGPQCPNVVAGQPCPPRPIAITVTVLDRSMHEVTRFTTGSDGRFRASLAPGTYALAALPDASGAPPALSPEIVTVSVGGYTSVNLDVDTGIR